MPIKLPIEIALYMPHGIISTWGTIQWPSRSPDLTPTDYFLWGYLKNKVFKILQLHWTSLVLEEAVERRKQQIADLERLWKHVAENGTAQDPSPTSERI
uniref:Uncharacterized protein n=1 Tax=Rhodnius prolixus TaxID=13249 RepID=T1HQ67_RHOPR